MSKIKFVLSTLILPLILNSIFCSTISEFLVNTNTTGNQTYSSVTGLSNGGFVIAYESYVSEENGYDILGQIYDRSGNKTGSEFVANTNRTMKQLKPSVSAFSDGGFVIVYQSHDGRSDDIAGQLYDQSGNKSGNEFVVNVFKNDGQLNPSVKTLFYGGFIVTWQSWAQDGNKYGIYGQKYATDKITKIGSEFQINTYENFSQDKPHVAVFPDGGFVAVWRSDNQDSSKTGVFGQKYDKDGNRVGEELWINTYKTKNQTNPSVAVLNSGDFVVTWDSNGQDGNGYGVYGQIFDVNGNKKGHEFGVNTHTDSHQDRSEVTALFDGGFVVVWESNAQDSSGDGIYGQRFDMNGNPVNDEFHINVYTGHHQQYPQIATLSSGGFTVSWMSKIQDGDGYGIYAQRYNSSGNKVAVGTELFYENPITTFSMNQNIEVTQCQNYAHSFQVIPYSNDYYFTNFNNYHTNWISKDLSYNLNGKINIHPNKSSVPGNYVALACLIDSRSQKSCGNVSIAVSKNQPPVFDIVRETIEKCKSKTISFKAVDPEGGQVTYVDFENHGNSWARVTD